MEQNQQQPAASRCAVLSQQILECLREQRQSRLTVREYCLANAMSERPSTGGKRYTVSKGEKKRKAK